VERIIVMNKGMFYMTMCPEKFFRHDEGAGGSGLAAPQVTYILHKLKDNGFNVDVNATTIREARDTILKAMKEEGRC